MNNFGYIEKIVNSEIENKNIVGASVCVCRHGEYIYRNNFGWADKEKNIPMKDNTIFRMYSMTKPITAVAAMILMERGQLDLMQPVSDFIDTFEKQKVIAWGEDKPKDAKGKILIRDLLNMTSGLVYPGDWSEAVKYADVLFRENTDKILSGNGMSTYDFARAMGELPLAFEPSEQWCYGTSADVLGAVIEIASGKKFSEFLRDEIFVPLGMEDTGFFVPEEKRERFAQLYTDDENGNLIPFNSLHLCVGDYTAPPAFESGGAGLVSTADDYMKFANMLLNKGEYKGVRILGRKTVDFMTKPQLSENQKKYCQWDSLAGYSYGNLMRIMENPGLSGSNGDTGEFGWDGWTGVYFTINPAEDMVIMYMIQRCGAGFTQGVRKIRSAVYSGI